MLGTVGQKEERLLAHLERLNVSVPRYTSYPTAVDWGDVSREEQAHALRSLDQGAPISLYVHIPFCHSMCLYCGCAVVLNRDPKKEERYVEALLKEIEVIRSAISKPLPVLQLHFGGGTPTKLSSHQLERIMEKLTANFSFSDEAEIAIEIDPRTVAEDGYSKLRALKRMGFNRVSFGVQDTNQAVQEAVRRRQTLEVTKDTFRAAREMGFSRINIDLIYGLPLQTRSTFRDTMDTILEMSPDRIAMFSYARVPWLKPHQKAIPDRLLPQPRDKFLMYLDARRQAIEYGYTAIGMDHFAHPSDPISARFRAKSLQRNFQGYTVLDCETMIGLGMTAISDLPTGFFQNAKTLEEYYNAIETLSQPAVSRGKKVTFDDRLRRHVIQELMCHFSLDIDAVEKEWKIDFPSYFKPELDRLQWFSEEGFVSFSPDRRKLSLTENGELFVRNIASCFDAYYQKLQHKEGRYSKAI